MIPCKTKEMSPAPPDLSGRVALVTGASRGIGYHIAKKLAAAGAHVLAVARTISGLEELDDEIKACQQKTGKGESTLIPLDLQNMEGIDRIGEAINQRWGKLDILVANAATLGVISPLSHIEAKTFEKVININLTATWRLIRSVDPLMRKSDAGRVIVVSSSVAHSAPAFWGLYAASKSAIETMTRSWAQETKKTNMRINLVDPGRVRTAMRAQAMPGEDPSTLATPEEIAEQMIPLVDLKLKEHGMLYRASEMRWTSWRAPE